MPRTRTKKLRGAAAAAAIAAALPSTAAIAPDENTAVRARPLIKFVGGKGQLAPKIASLLPKQIKTYLEPFFGAGAVYFALANENRFESAVLGDMNEELIDILKAAQMYVEELIQFLNVYAYDRKMFAKIRDQDPKKLNLLMRAARTIYLNKTGFNGLYRLNSKGKFNVPFGRYTNPLICDEKNLRAVSALLGQHTTDLVVGDFACVLDLARAGDAVYFDPPYLPRSKTANFTSYTAERFDMKEHERLADCFRQLAKKDIAVVLSNADTEESRALYKGFKIETVQARRSVNSAVKKRGEVSEILVTANTS